MKRLLAIVVVLTLVMPGTFASAKDDESLYYDNGKVRETKKFYPAGNLKEVDCYRQDGTLQEMQTYDKIGNKLSESNYGFNGKLMENSDGWSALRWTYAGGNMTSETYYSAGGRIKERKIFNSAGDLVGKQYVGDQGIDPSEEFNPWPTVSGESISYYDKYGRSEGTTAAEVW